MNTITDSNLKVDSSQESYISRLQQLVEALRVSCGQSNVLMAISDNRYHRQHIIKQYEAALATHGIICHQICLDTSVLPQALTDLAETVDFRSPKTIVTVLGTELTVSAWFKIIKPDHVDQLLEKLRWTPELLEEFQVPLIIWLPKYLVNHIRDVTPDFWTRSGGEFEFLQPVVWDVSKVCPKQPEIATSVAMDVEPLKTEKVITARKLRDQADNYQKRRKYRDAETFYQQSLTIFKQADVQQEIARTLTRLAQTHCSQQHYEQSELLYLESLDCWKQLLPSANTEVIDTLMVLADLYKTCARHEEAELLYLNVLTLQKKLLGESEPDIVFTLDKLGNLYNAACQYDQSETRYLEALTLRKNLLGMHHPQVADSLERLGLFYYLRQRYDEAESSYLEALALQKQFLGDQHPKVVKTLSRFGKLYAKQQRYKKAEAYYSEALSLCRQWCRIDGITPTLRAEPEVDLEVMRNLAQVEMKAVLEGLKDLYKVQQE